MHRWASWKEGVDELHYHFQFMTKNEHLCIQQSGKVIPLGIVSDLEMFYYQNIEGNIHNVLQFIKANKVYRLRFKVEDGAVEFLNMSEWDWRKQVCIE